jgi:hypothetical protein
MLTQADTGTAAVLVDELDACPLHSQVNFYCLSLYDRPRGRQEPPAVLSSEPIRWLQPPISSPCPRFAVASHSDGRGQKIAFMQTIECVSENWLRFARLHPDAIAAVDKRHQVVRVQSFLLHVVFNCFDWIGQIKG